MIITPESTDAKNVFIARQPIFDRQNRIYAYELLYRSGFENYYKASDADLATTQTLTNSFFVFGMDEVTGGKRAFVNFTRNLIVNETAAIFPNNLMAVEILEDINPDKEVLEACRRLKKKGFTLVLDDFVFREGLEELLQLADIVKIDFTMSEPLDIQSIMSQPNMDKTKVLAEKVETHEQYAEAYKLGYSYFQGYYFCKPNIIMGKDIPVAKQNYLAIIREVNAKEIDFGRIESIIKHDLSLSYKFLHLINSAAFGLRSKVQSIKQALALLGINEFRKWISLIALTQIGEDKPLELISLSIIRARFCEEIGSYAGLGNNKTDNFFLGMFSLLDAFVDKPMRQIIRDLPVSDYVKKALLGEKNRHRAVLEMMICYERGNWKRYDAFTKLLRIDEKTVSRTYLDAITWAVSMTE